jgi:PAS domain S-box-containing protein
MAQLPVGDGLFEEFVAATSDGVIVVDEAGEIRYANPAAERTLDHEPGSLRGRALAVLSPDTGETGPDPGGGAGPTDGGDGIDLAGGGPPPVPGGDAPGLETPAALVAAVREGGVDRATADVAVETGDGRTVPATATVATVAVDGEDLVVVSLREFEGRLAHYRALERARSVVDAVGDGIYWLDENGVIYDVNDVVVERTGYDRSELVGEHVSVLLSEDDVVESASVIAEVLADEDREVGHLQFDVHTRDGEAVPCEAKIVVLTEGDRFVGTVGLVRDVSDRLAHERRIRAQSAAMEAASDGIAILDEEGRYVYTNDAFAALYGFEDPGDLVGEPWHDQYPTEERHRIEREGFPTVAESGAWTAEAVGQRRDGSRLHQEVTMVAIDDGGTAVAVRDRTAEVDHRRRLEALTAAISELMGTADTDAIAARTVAAVEEVLGHEVVCVRLFDADTNSLRIAANSDRAERLVETCPAFDLEASAAGRAYRQGELVTGETGADDGDCPGAAVRENLHVPMGECGTLSVFAPEPFDPVEVHKLELLAANVETAVERTERERRLRAAREDLRHQHAELETLTRVTALVGELIRRLVEKTTREEVYRTVCERLAASEFYDSAWIGTVETTDGRATLVAESGLTDAYREAVDAIPLAYLANGSVAEAVRTGEIQVVQEYYLPSDHRAEVPAGEATDESGVGTADGGADDGTASGGKTIASVPITYGERTHGVLVVTTSREDVVVESARAGFEVLADVVGFVITAALQRELLHSDTVVELEFDVRDPRCLPVAVSGARETRCWLEKITPIGDGVYRLFLWVAEPEPAAVLAALDERPDVEAARVVREDGERVLVEVTTRETVYPVLLEMGASAPELSAEDGVGRLVVEASPATDVRELVDSLTETFPDSELRSKRELDHPVRTTAELRREIEEDLTEKQRIAIETAYVLGYYEWPRHRNAKEIAASLDISAPTFHQHLRAAERRLVEAIFGDDDSTPTRDRTG